MRHAKTRALYEYWNDLRDGRAAPYRREIDPREIAPLLESTFILEVQNPDSVRFRLAGTRLCESFGMELRGMSALALWHGDCRSKVRDAIRTVSTRPAIARLSCTVENRGGFLYNAEFLYMPLKSDFDDFSRILGCGYYMGESGAFAHLYPPTHHWVDTVDIIEIEATRADDTPPPEVGAGEHLPTSLPFETIRGLRRRAAGPQEPVAPKLVAIQGGRNLAPPPMERPRGHLRLIKDEVN